MITGIKGKFTEKQFLDKELVITLIESGYTHTKTLAQIIGVGCGLIVAHHAGFASRTAYRTYLAQQKGFASRNAYKEHLAKQRGFDSYGDYLALVNNPLVLIIAALKDSGRPLNLGDIYNYIANNFGIKFNQRCGRLEKTIKQANHILPEPLFVEQDGVWSLNLGNSYLEEILHAESAQDGN